MTFSTAKYTIIQQTRGPRRSQVVVVVVKPQLVSRADLEKGVWEDGPLVFNLV